jgi:K+-sensing histidine kinase KdpD
LNTRTYREFAFSRRSREHRARIQPPPAALRQIWPPTPATGGALHDRLNRRDTLIELIRSVNATLDPRKVADALLGQVHGWFPAACTVVAVQDGSQHASLIAERGPCEPYSKSLEHIARWITEHNEEFMTANLATDERVPDGPAAAVIGFPLRCRARTIGALIALDPAPSRDTPTLPPEVMSSLRTVLEGPALALDTMMHAAVRTCR